MSKISQFLHSGLERHRRAIVTQFEQIRTEVEAEFSEQLSNATFWQRFNIRRAIRREIARRLPPKPSANSLYATK
jgi:hypothetical protein